ncbi:unnamed protein product [Adineta steineri]|uniref:PLAT domain-containing protein n=4 Tax=Adineta steineri TaxID=433720 RepID=A0A813QB69_9BILA|nr:unnamed protein product [Adineta steineri]
MDVKYIGGDIPWTLPFGDHFNSSSQASLNNTHKNNLLSANDLEEIARRYDFEPLYSSDKKQPATKFPFDNDNLQWMNAGTFFSDKTIEPHLTGNDKTDFLDNHGHTFCYLCSINYPHHHERTKPRDHSQRRKLIPYNNPKALKTRSASIDRSASNSSLSNSIPYRFIVRTRPGKRSGTRAQVFLYMYGTENDWTSINLHARTNQTTDGFPSGSTRTFCFKGPDIGHLHHLNVNLVGARSDKEWFLKEIEITNLNTSVTWLCEFNCWLPKVGDEKQFHVKPTINPQREIPIENLSVYILQVLTGGKRFAGTDSNIQVTIRGSTSETRKLALTSNNADLFEQNQLDTFAIVGWDIGDLSEITVESDKTQLASDWDLKEMIMWKILPSDNHKLTQIYFPFNNWLGTKESKLKAKKEVYPVIDHHRRGPICYEITVKTGKDFGGGTDANVFIIIYGESGRTVTHELDNLGKNDFERNTTSEFTIMDLDVGKIDRIKIWHDNSGVGAAWLLDNVTVRKKYSTSRSITNIFIQRLEQISNVLYYQIRKQVQKNHSVRTSDRKSEHSNDDLDNNRSILRKNSLHKKVTWDENSIGSQEDLIANDKTRMKSKQTTVEQKSKKDDLLAPNEAGHFEHQTYWISSHSYTDKKWQIKSIEEQNSFNLEQSIRSLLLSDRSTISSKIKTPINERDDDIYEFEAKRWLAKDKNDGKTEVYLTPKSIQLSTHTNTEMKTKPKPLADTLNDTQKKHFTSSSKSSSELRYEEEHSKRSTQHDLGSLQKSPRSLTSLDRPPSDTTKTKIDQSHELKRSSSTLKRQEEPFIDKYQRPSSPNQHTKSPRDHHDPIIPSASERELLARVSGEPPYHSRSAATSLLDTRSSDLYNQRSKSPRLNNEPASPLTSNRDQSARKPSELPHHSRPAATSLIDTRSSDLYNQHSRSPRLNTDLTSPLTSNRDVPSRMSTESLHHPRSSDLHSQHSKPPRDNRDRVTPSSSERELLARITGEPPHHSRSAATSVLDTRSSDLYNQYSRSPRSNNEPASPLTSNRDVSARKPSELPHHSRPLTTSLTDTRSSDLYNQRPKSSRLNNDITSPLTSNRDVLSRKPPESPSTKTSTSRHQVYSSAYGTLPTDDF